MKKILIALITTICLGFGANAQSLVAEIGWTDVENTYYQGVLVMYPNNQGTLYVWFYNPMVGNVAVAQSAVMSFDYDGTAYVNCGNPSTNPYVPYAADNFIFFNDGSVFTQDYSGKYTTNVVYRVVPSNEWHSVFAKYGL